MGTDELLLEMSVRYLAPEKVPGYLKFARELGEHVAIYLRPQRWLYFLAPLAACCGTPADRAAGPDRALLQDGQVTHSVV